MTKQEQQARAMIAAADDQRLIELWEVTTFSRAPGTFAVRGWLMDEFEKRDKAAFEAWLDSEDCSDDTLADYFLKK